MEPSFLSTEVVEADVMVAIVSPVDRATSERGLSLGRVGKGSEAKLGAPCQAAFYTETLAYPNCHESRDKIEESHRQRDGLDQIQKG